MEDIIERRQKFLESFATRAIALLAECKRSLVVAGLLSTVSLLKSWLSAVSGIAKMPPTAQMIPRLFHGVLIQDFEKINSMALVKPKENKLQEMVIYRALADFPYHSFAGIESMYYFSHFYSTVI
jgi:hypothetical protein